MDLLRRNNIKVGGRGTKPIIFAHGFGCDQTMWRHITPAFEDNYKIVTFDHVGSGRSDLSAYSRARYGSLEGYALDVLQICAALDLTSAVFVGHSVSAIIGVLAAIREPMRFSDLVLIGPSPRYLNDEGYVGGFERKDIDELLESLDSNYLGWASTMAPIIMGRPDRPALGDELKNSFCRTDPEIAKHFARVTFLGDNRKDLPQVKTRSLVVQCSNDAIAPVDVGHYCKAHIPQSELVILEATGHCPHLSAPEETLGAIRDFLR